MSKQSKSHKPKMFGRKAGTAFAIGLCMPIILCALLAYEDLVEPKWQMLQVQKNKRVDKPSEVAPARFKSDVGKCFVFFSCVKTCEWREVDRDRKQHTDSGSVAPQ